MADHSPYLQHVLMNTGEVIAAATETLSHYDDEYDAIVCTGISGLLLGPMLAHLLGKRLAVVRKPEDKDNHAVVRIESSMSRNDRWIFLDDLVASGGTIQRVLESMDVSPGYAGPMVGCYLYNDDRWTGGRWCDVY